MSTPDTFPFGPPGGAPSGAAGGDLAGTYPNPRVAKASSGIAVGSASAPSGNYAATFDNTWMGNSVASVQNHHATGISSIDFLPAGYPSDNQGATIGFGNHAVHTDPWAQMLGFQTFNANASGNNAPDMCFAQQGLNLAAPGIWRFRLVGNPLTGETIGDIVLYKYSATTAAGSGLPSTGIAMQYRADNSRMSFALPLIADSLGGISTAIPGSLPALPAGQVVDIFTPNFVAAGSGCLFAQDVAFIRTGSGMQVFNAISGATSTLILTNSMTNNVDKTAQLAFLSKANTRVNLFTCYTDYSGGAAGAWFGHGGDVPIWFYDFQAGAGGATTFGINSNGVVVNGGQTIKKVLSATATLDFPATALASSSDLTVTVTGAAVGDPVFLGVPNGSVNANSDFFAWVSAANTVTVRFSNYSALSIDPASGAFRVCLFQF